MKKEKKNHIWIGSCTRGSNFVNEYWWFIYKLLICYKLTAYDTKRLIILSQVWFFSSRFQHRTRSGLYWFE